jgi:hypothetical protein
MDELITLIPAPPDVHAMYAGENSGEVLSEPVMAVALVKTTTGKAKTKVVEQVPRVMVMKVGSDRLIFPGDIGSFLGVGSPEDIDKFWSTQSVEWHDDQDGIDEGIEGLGEET